MFQLFQRGRIPSRSCLLLIVIPMFAAAVVLKIVFHYVPTPRPPMLSKADGLVEAPTVDEAQPHTVMPIALPEDTLGSAPYDVGVYTRGRGALPVGSVAIEMVSSGQRFVEIVERPGTTVQDTVDDYAAIATQDVSLRNQTAKLLTLKTRGVTCVSNDTRWNLPGFCELEHMLVFQTDAATVSIAADDAHATDGELITLANGMLPAEATMEPVP